jgi:transposase InsO family protein
MEKGLNQKIERLNGTMRDKEKVMHGINRKESSQRLIEAFKVHYNLLREHSSIKQILAE